MNKILLRSENRVGSIVPAHSKGVGDWQRWAPYAAITWSLFYAALGTYWAVSGHGFPYAPEIMSNSSGPLLGQLGPGMAWIVVLLAGIPAAAMGVVMVRGVRVLRTLFLTVGTLLAGTLFFLMTDLELLALLGYIPLIIFKLFTGDEIGFYLETITRWTVIHQWLCLIGGFLWLGATVSYARRSGDACLYCGRQDGPERWTSPNQAARWGRIAVYISMLVPVLYAITRYAWALGFPLGMSEEHWRWGQERGEWISGLFLANFGLVGAILMLGLVQRWGEVFPRWMIGLAGRRVPIALAVVPASIMSVLFIVAGITLWSGYKQMVEAAAASGLDFWIIAGPVAVFPVWGVALAVATLGYYYRRRGPCEVCGRGESGEPSSKYPGKIS
jgi:hypothetical protein